MGDPFLGPYADIEKLRRRAREVLGVPDGAGAEEIRRAFHGLARRCHPDVATTRADFTRIVNAYLILTQPDPRGFDLDADPAGPPPVPEELEDYFDWWKRRFFP